MITRIARPASGSLGRGALTALSARISGSAAGPSKPPARPRKGERIDDYTVAPDPSLAFSTDKRSSTTAHDVALSRKRYGSPYEAPVLKANPYADTYRIREEEMLGVGDGGESLGRFERPLGLGGAGPSIPDGPGLSSKVSTGTADLFQKAKVSTRKDSSDSNVLTTRELVEKLRQERERVCLANDGHRSTSNPTRLGRTSATPEGKVEWHTFGAEKFGFDRNALWYEDTAEVSDEKRKAYPIVYQRLRDACPCPKCIDPSTRQRTHTSPEAYRAAQNSAIVKNGPKDLVTPETVDCVPGLRVQWSEDHSAFYTFARIAELATGLYAKRTRYNVPPRVFWDRDTLLAQQEHLYTRYDALSGDGSDQAMYDMLKQLHRFGIVIIKGVPTDRTSDKDCTLREVMGQIGELRNTFYGETWNVKNVANSKNVAYTNLNLGLHMDLLYFSSPPRFQALHCLRNRVEGGSSYFVDGMAAAETYSKKGGKSVRIVYEYDNDAHYLRHAHLLVEGPLRGLKASVNWSPPFQAAPMPPYAGIDTPTQYEWYKHLSMFQTILDEPHRKWEFTMEEGDLVLFDNRRVLHARTAFRDLTAEEAKNRGVEVIEGEPSRWLKGCYLDGEVVWNKIVTLARKLEI